MAVRIRPSLLVFVFIALAMSVASALQDPELPALPTKAERAVLRNSYGAVIQDAEGKRITYSRDELEAQARASGTSVPPVPGETLLTASSAEATWGYAAFGSGIGLSNIIISASGSPPELYMGGSSGTFGGNAYWYALRYNAATQGYDQVYVSPFFDSGIRRIKVGNLIGDSAKEIAVALSNGQVVLYNQETKAVLQTVNTAVTDLFGLDIADVDGDGTNELVLCSTNHLYVYSGAGVLKWDLTGVGGYQLVTAQMDDDPALEVATTDGHVVDCTTHLIQWTWSYGFGARLTAADFDHDGRDELIVGEYGFVWAYDVERQLPKWSISEYVEAMLVTDIDNDGHLEVLVGQGQWGSIECYDLETQQKEWFIQNPEHGVTNIAVGDVDGDGKTELLWGAGASSTGPDYLYVVDWQTKQFKWQNLHLDGPFIGPEIGDLDGDGRDEMVVISNTSNSGYSSGRILVFDAVTRKLRGISGPTMGGFGWTGIHDLKLRDVNSDGKMEILVAASFLYDGMIEIYGFDSSNIFTLNWTNSTTLSSTPFYCVDAVDIDNDGEKEIIGGAGGYLYVYSYATRNEKWHTLYMRGLPLAVGVADLNGDGTKELIGMVNGGDVYIFDGHSRDVEAILTGPFTSMRVQNVGGFPSIVLGNNAGYVIIYRYSSGSYVVTYRQKLINSSVDGFTIDSRERLWIGSGVYSPSTLTEVTLGGAVLATYSGYGSSFGLRTAFVPASLSFFTTGSYSVEAFATCTASLSSSSKTFTSAGGIESVGITAGSDCDWGSVSNASWISITSGGSSSGNGTLTYSVAQNSGSARTGTMTIAGQLFTVNQIGKSASIGLYDPAGGAFFLRNSSTSGIADIAFTYGPANQGWIPLAGDFNGDGIDTIGLYFPGTGGFFLRNSNAPGIADIAFTFGPAGQNWIPLVGDWNGDGIDTVGLYYPASGVFFLRNTNDSGIANITFTFGPGGAGWIPIAGDWNGDGVDTVGLYNSTGGAFFLRNSNSSGLTDVAFTYGPAGLGWLPVVGDWNGDGMDTIGLYNQGNGAYYLRNSHSSGIADITFTYGPAGLGWQPIVGDWDGL